MTITYGWDASHYDSLPNGQLVVSQGFGFMTHKAGGDQADADLAGWWRAMRPYRSQVLLGAYWVLYPGNPVGRADAFIARLDSQCPGWRDGPFLLQADCEEWNQNPGTQPGLGDVRAFCDRLRAVMPKLRPVVYASAGQYGGALAGLGYPLWNANYWLNNQAGTASGLYARSGGDNGRGWAAYSGQTPAIWQFSSSATIAGQTTCDANAYRGTLAELTSLVAPGWENDVNLTDKIYRTGDNMTDDPGREVGDVLRDDAKLGGFLRGAFDAKTADLPAGAPAVQLAGVPARLTELEAKVDKLIAAGPTAPVAISQDVLVAALLAALAQLAAPKPAA